MSRTKPTKNLEPISFWSYRVMKYEDSVLGTSYGIHEVFFNENKEPITWTERAVGVVEQSSEDMIKTLDNMRLALRSPVLDYETGKEIADVEPTGKVP